MGRLVSIGDTCLNVEERGDGDLAVLALHGGPGLDHHEFGWWLDPLADEHRLILVDQRAQGRSLDAPPETWTVERCARDAGALAEALGLQRYVVLGHSFGAIVALQAAVLGPADGRVGTVVSSGVPAPRFLAGLDERLDAFEPIDLRELVMASFEREATVRTHADVAAVVRDQLPFHFADPRDPRIGDLLTALAPARYAPALLRAAATGALAIPDLEHALGGIAEPVLVLAGAHDRVLPPEGSQAMAAAIPGARLEILDRSGHMTFVEQPAEYVDALLDFLAGLR